MSATTPTARGIALPCPLCGEENAAVKLDLSDMDTCTCDSCDAEFSLTDLQARMERWQRLLAWVALAPAEGGAE